MSNNKYVLGDEPAPGFRLEAFLGEGGFGQVWKAAAPGGTEVALKIIGLSGKDGLKEFRGLRLVKRIRHPHLVPIVAYWLKDREGRLVDESGLEADSGPARPPSPRGTMMAMPAPMTPAPFTPGAASSAADDTKRPIELLIAMGLGERDLFHRLEECKATGQSGIPLPELLGYMADAASAIDYLNEPRHGDGKIAIQHCDIKPFNIMIVGGRAQVCDFGLARMLGDVRRTSASGTVAYAAPECISKNQPSATTDQYSLAVSYVELRTGELPYPSESYGDVINAITTGNLDLSKLPPTERAVIRKATSQDPARRYPSAEEMVVALRNSVEGGRSTPRRALGLVAALLLSGAAGSIAVWRPWEKRGSQVADGAGPGEKGREKQQSKNGEGVNGEQTENGVAPDLQQQTDKNRGADAKKPLEQPAVKSAADVLAEATALFEADRKQDCIELLTRRLEGGTSATPEIMLLRGTCYLALHRPLEAAADLDFATAGEPGDAKGWSRLGAARLALEDYSGTVDALTKAIAIKPHAGDLVSRGIAHSNLNQPEEASKDFIAAVEVDPTDSEARFYRAEMFAGQERFGEAVEDYTAALRSGIDDPAEMHDLRAKAARLAHLPELAAFDQRIVSLLGLPSDDADAQAELAWLLATASVEAVRDGARALEYAKTACELTQDEDVRSLDALAAAHAELGDFAGAEKTATRAADLAQGEAKVQIEARRDRYRQRQPYREALAAQAPE